MPAAPRGRPPGKFPPARKARLGAAPRAAPARGGGGGGGETSQRRFRGAGGGCGARATRARRTLPTCFPAAAARGSPFGSGPSAALREAHPGGGKPQPGRGGEHRRKETNAKRKTTLGRPRTFGLVK
ncbi:hypothetical protein VULLAG_LOCUS21706 [Vulpes lagopus]